MKKMSEYESYSRLLTWFMALLLVAFVAGCGSGGDGGRDPVLGTGVGLGGGGGGGGGGGAVRKLVNCVEGNVSV